MLKIRRVLIPAVVPVATYFIVDRLFPEKAKPYENLPGGSNDEQKLVQKVVKKVFNRRALKFAIISGFATTAIQQFQTEIEALLINDVFDTVCSRDVDNELKIVCNIIEDHNLNFHTQSMKSLIVSNNLTQDQKVSLLKIKLDFLINGEYNGKVRFLVMAIVGAVFACTVSGVGGLALLLDALSRLFEEGKISKALYKQILKALARRWGGKNVPIDHLLD